IVLGLGSLAPLAAACECDLGGLEKGASPGARLRLSEALDHSGNEDDKKETEPFCAASHPLFLAQVLWNEISESRHRLQKWWRLANSLDFDHMCRILQEKGAD